MKSLSRRCQERQRELRRREGDVLRTSGRCSISISSTMLFGTWPTSPMKFRARHHFFELSSISISSPRRTVSSLLFCPLRSIFTAQILSRTKSVSWCGSDGYLLGSDTFTVDGPGMLVLHVRIVIIEDGVLRCTLHCGWIEMASHWCCRRRLSNVGGIVVCYQSIIRVDWIWLLKRTKDGRLIDRIGWTYIGRCCCRRRCPDCWLSFIVLREWMRSHHSVITAYDL